MRIGGDTTSPRPSPPQAAERETGVARPKGTHRELLHLTESLPARSSPGERDRAAAPTIYCHFRAEAKNRQIKRNRLCRVGLNPPQIGIANMNKRIIFYSSVKLNLKSARMILAPVAVLLLCAGCGGVNASRSVSPASFFIPGLLKAEPKPPTPDDSVPPPAPVKQLASLNN